MRATCVFERFIKYLRGRVGLLVYPVRFDNRFIGDLSYLFFFTFLGVLVFSLSLIYLRLLFVTTCHHKDDS